MTASDTGPAGPAPSERGASSTDSTLNRIAGGRDQSGPGQPGENGSDDAGLVGRRAGQVASVASSGRSETTGKRREATTQIGVLVPQVSDLTGEGLPVVPRGGHAFAGNGAEEGLRRGPEPGSAGRPPARRSDVNEGYPWLDVGERRTWDQINVGDEVRWVNGYADWQRVVSIRPVIVVRLANGEVHHMSAEYTSVVKTARRDVSDDTPPAALAPASDDASGQTAASGDSPAPGGAE